MNRTGQINILFSIIGIRFVLNYIEKNKEIWSIILFILFLPLIAAFAGRFFEYGMLPCVIGFLGYIVHIYSNNLKLPIFSNKYVIAFYALISVILTYIYNELNFWFEGVSLLLSYIHSLWFITVYLFLTLTTNCALQYKTTKCLMYSNLKKCALYLCISLVDFWRYILFYKRVKKRLESIEKSYLFDNNGNDTSFIYFLQKTHEKINDQIFY